MDLNDTFRKWKEFARGKRVVTIVIDEEEIFRNVKDYKTPRDFISSVLAARDLEVTRWTHEYAGDTVTKWGLVYAKTDSDFRLSIEVHGIVGENLRERATDEQSSTKIITGI